MNLGRLLLIIMISLMSVQQAHAGAAEMLEFQTKFAAESRQLEQLQSQVRGFCRLRATSRIPQVAPFAHDISFAKMGGSVKAEVRRLNPKDEKTGIRDDVYCLTPESSFRLAKTNADSGFDVHSLGEPDDHLDVMFDTVFGRFLAASYSVYGTRLYKQMNTPSFKLVDVQRVPGKGKSLMRVAYEIGGSGPVNKGSVVCDPEQHWAFQSGELEVVIDQFKTKYTFDVQYQTVAGVPFPLTVTYVDPDARRIVAQFSNIQFGETPRDQFTMPYYGLPDLVDRRQDAPWVRLGLISLLSVAIFGAGLATYRLAFRRRNRIKSL